MKTPVNVSQKLIATSDDSDSVNKDIYQSAVGSLIYLSTPTRPDLAYAVSSVARYCPNRPWQPSNVLLRDTTTYGLLYGKGNSGQCVGYSDADWAGDINDCRSTSGYIFLFWWCSCQLEESKVIVCSSIS